MFALLALILLAALPAGIELLLRWRMPWLDAFCVITPCERMLFDLDPETMPGMSPASRLFTNSRGIRGREFSPRDRYRVLGMGCSVAISTYLDQDKTWSALLERFLSDQIHDQVWVGAVGRSEVTSRDVVTFMRYFVPQYKDEIDLVIVLVGVNDLALMLSKANGYEPSFLERAGVKHQMSRAFARVPDRYSDLPFYHRLALWKVASCARRKLRLRRFEGIGSVYEEHRRLRQQAVTIGTLPDLTRGLDEYTRNIDTIIDLAANSIRLLFTTHPTMWRSDLSPAEEKLLWFGWLGDSGQFYTTEVLAQGMALYNRRLLDTCQARGVPCLDLASVVPKNTQALCDDVHLNEPGSHLVAQTVAYYLGTEPSLSPSR